MVALAMSGSGGSQTPRRSDMQRKLTEVLHSVEKAHKADIHTYSSGHLGPNSLTHKPLYCRPHKPNWNKPKRTHMRPARLQERRKMEANVEETINALHGFTIAPTLQEPQIQERPESSREELLTTDLRGVPDMTELATLRKAKQEGCAGADMVEEDRQKAEITWSDRLRHRQHFDMQVLSTKDLTTRKCLIGGEAAKRHERRLQQVRIIDGAKWKSLHYLTFYIFLY